MALEDELESETDLLNQLTITLDLDSVEHVRRVYTIWDVLGDTGGLIDMLCLLCKPLIILYHGIVGSGMTRFLIQSLFVLQKKVNKPDVFSQIKRRTQFK